MIYCAERLLTRTNRKLEELRDDDMAFDETTNGWAHPCREG